MTRPGKPTKPPKAEPGPHPIQVSRAFLDDIDHRARPARLESVEGEVVVIRNLDDTTTQVTVTDPKRLAKVLARPDVCRLRDLPLLLVNEHYGLLGIATGPATPPSRLEVLIVSRLEDGRVVELINDDPQPSWQIFALR